MIITTLLLSALMMCGFFLLLWAGVGFIQDKKLFSTAPKEVLALIEPKKERFRGQHIVGYLLAILAIALLIVPVFAGIIDGINKNFSFLQFFLRFSTMSILLKIFDIIFFDWVLLCNRGFRFFEHYYPEVIPVLNPNLFGFNKKEHAMHIIGMLFFSTILAGLLVLYM